MSRKHGDGAQPAHDAADAQRVGDGLAQAVLPGDLEVDHRARPVATDLKHRDSIVSTGQGGAAVQGSLDHRLDTQPGRQPLSHCQRAAQPLGIDIVQADGGIGQFRIAQDVAQQVLGEDRAAGADAGDFGHGGAVAPSG
jgi:hypothetical protein